MWESYLAVALGGALGSVARFTVVESFIRWFGDALPFGTLCVNFIGSFLIGLVFFYTVERYSMPEWRVFLMVGCLGGFTTMSSFSLELVSMLRSDMLWEALLYFSATSLACVLATFAAILLARGW